MIRRDRKTLFILCGLLIGCTIQPVTAKAGLIADTWMAIFGPPGTPYFPGAYRTSYFGPSYYSAYSASYRANCCPPRRVYYVPSCQPCDPCGLVCPTPCDPCTSGNCQVSPGTADNAYNSGQPPQTFKKPVPAKDGDPDSKFKSRDGSKKFEATPKSKPKPGTDEDKKETPFPTPADDGDGDGKGSSKTGAIERKTFKNPIKTDIDIPRGPVIRQKKPVPAKIPMQKKKEKSGTPAKKNVPALILPNFDEKIAWRPVVQRTRLIIHSRISQPRLTRTIVDPNNGWKPVRNDVRVVRK